MMAALSAKSQVQQTAWGTVEGKPVSLFTLSSPELTVSITNYGARVVSIVAPDREGRKADVALGYKDLAGYVADNQTYVGSVVGRYGNRIANGRFVIDGKEYQVPKNDKTNALHGGTTGFDRKVWSARELPDGVELTLVSPDGDMGFPGTLTVHVRYTLEGASLHIVYIATTDKPTVLNLTNHSYFNLAGESSGTVLDQQVTIHADRFTPVDARLIPTGQLLSVEGTPLDFRRGAAIGARIHDQYQQLELAGGYDHNFVLDGSGLREAARVVDPRSGRTLTVSTTQPGIQFYSGNFLKGAFTGVSSKPYEKYAGFCLETQHYPNSPNEPAFPSTLLRPGETFHSATVLTFGVQR
jgi:aldose 1-epimerase